MDILERCVSMRDKLQHLDLVRIHVSERAAISLRTAVCVEAARRADPYHQRGFVEEHRVEDADVAALVSGAVDEDGPLLAKNRRGVLEDDRIGARVDEIVETLAFRQLLHLIGQAGPAPQISTLRMRSLPAAPSNV